MHMSLRRGEKASNKPLDEPTAENGSPVPYNESDELKGLTLYEKKCVLINREIDNNGMGKYQWYIWTLCGFGYLLDLMWAQAFGLILSPLKQELGFPVQQSGNISVAFSSGLTAGAFIWGVLGDIVGRYSGACQFHEPQNSVLTFRQVDNGPLI